jgi:hypothetical protein
MDIPNAFSSRTPQELQSKLKSHRVQLRVPPARAHRTSYRGSNLGIADVELHLCKLSRLVVRAVPVFANSHLGQLLLFHRLQLLIRLCCTSKGY